MSNALAEKIGAVPATQSITTFNLYLYGDFGAGKTHLASTAQDHKSTSPVLFLDVEGGSATFRHRADIDVVQVREMAQIKAIHDAIHADAGKSYRTVVVDSLSELQKLDMKEIMLAAVRANANQDIDVPSPREWGKTLAHMRNIVRAYRDLPCNVIFTALATKTTDDSTGQVKYMPSLQGRALFEIPAFFDVVAYLDTVIEKDNVERRLIVGGNPKYTVKDRLGVGDPIILNPTIPMLWDNLNKGTA